MRLASILATLHLGLAPCLCQSPEPTGIARESAKMPIALRADAPTRPTPPPGENDGAQPVPEPSTLLLVGSGLVGVAFAARRRRRRVEPSAS